jgi:hypothetical protein
MTAQLILRILAIATKFPFTVKPLKMIPNDQKMKGHINNLIIYIEVVYTGWLVIPKEKNIMYNKKEHEDS